MPAGDRPAARRAGAREGLIDAERGSSAKAPDARTLSHVPWHTILTVAVLGMVVYLLIPQIGKFPEAWQSIRHAEPAWLAVAVVATAGIFVAGGVQLTGATSLPVPALRAAAAQLAAAFAAKLTPAGVGAVGVRVRFLQRSGLEHGA